MSKSAKVYIKAKIENAYNASFKSSPKAYFKMILQYSEFNRSDDRNVVDYTNTTAEIVAVSVYEMFTPPFL